MLLQEHDDISVGKNWENGDFQSCFKTERLDLTIKGCYYEHYLEKC